VELSSYHAPLEDMQEFFFAMQIKIHISSDPKGDNKRDKKQNRESQLLKAVNTRN